MGKTAPESSAAVPPNLDRLVSLDAYRGLTMLLMASGGLGLAEVAKRFPDSRLWQAVSFHVSHVPWQGCSLWDLIQPSFMFMVGVAAAYSFVSRKAAGQSYGAMTWHAFVRAAVLVLLGVFLRRAIRSKRTSRSRTSSVKSGWDTSFSSCSAAARRACSGPRPP